jgi:hypothetical protein
MEDVAASVVLVLIRSAAADPAHVPHPLLRRWRQSRPRISRRVEGYAPTRATQPLRRSENPPPDIAFTSKLMED